MRAFVAHGNHAIHERADATGARCPLIQRHPQHRQDFVEVSPSNGLNQCELVRKILIERPDADARRIGNRIRSESRPAPLAQNASRAIENELDRRPRTRLARLSAQVRGRRGCMQEQ